MVNPQRSWENFQKNVSKPPIKQMTEDTAQDTQQEENQGRSWGNYLNTSTYQGEVDPTKDESALDYIVRNLSSNAARAAEAIGGRFGNAQEFVRMTAQKLPKSTGFLGNAIYELIGQENWDKLFAKPNDQLSGIRFPTSDDLRNVTEGVTGEFTKPKTKNEERLQNLTSDIGASLGRKPTSKSDFLKNNLGIPIAANAAKETVSGLGFGDDKANWTKGAVWLALSLAGNVNASGFAAQQMNKGRTGIPQNVQFDQQRLINNLNRINKGMASNDPRSQLARQQISDLIRDVQNGRTSVRDLMTAYDGVNASSRSRGMFDIAKNDRQYARSSINQVRDAVRDEINASGSAYPEALKAWNTGRQAFATIHRSNAIENWINDLANSPKAKLFAYPTTALFGMGGSHGVGAPFIPLSGSAIGPAVYQSGKVLMRVTTNKDLAKYYWEAMNAAQQQNVHAFIMNYNKLGKEYEKKYGKEESANKPADKKSKTKK